jgi:hypothetical protein
MDNQREKLRAKIILGAAMVGVVIPESEIQCIVSKAINTAKQDGYAFISGRNYGITVKRKRAAAERLEAFNALQLAKRTKAEEIEFKNEEARQELLGVVAKLVSSGISENHIKHLGALVQTYVNNVTDEELAKVWPGTSRDLRYQWRHRGKMLVLKQPISDNLRRFLDLKLFPR